MRVVYVDTLFLLNLLVDYFLLRLTASVGGVYPKFSRMFLGAMVGAILAVILFFLPLPGWGALLCQMATCSLTVWTAFGKQSGYRWLRLCGLFFTLTILSVGAVFGLSLQNRNVKQRNGVIYMNISIPVMAISFTLISALSRLVFGKGRGEVSRSYIEIAAEKEGKRVSFRALKDTGNLLRDPVSGKRVMILQAETAAELFSGTGRVLLQNLSQKPEDWDLERLRRCCKTAFWLLPVHTAVQDGMMLVFRPDKLFLDGKPTSEYVIGLSAGQMEIGGDCHAVIGV